MCLNIAEAAGRSTRADKARAFAVARGEAIEAIACVEIAALAGDARGESVARVVELIAMASSGRHHLWMAAHRADSAPDQPNPQTRSGFASAESAQFAGSTAVG